MKGHSSPGGATVGEKRADVLKMRDGMLAELYAEKPETKAKIANAAGYGTFSNININLFLASTGNGYGVVHNNGKGDDTYMRMAMVGIGLGLGVKDFRAAIIFKNQDALSTFVDKGWEFGGHADAAAKAGDKGGAANVAGDITSGMEIYQFTESGIALQATIAGTKYWKDKELN
ncbi:MAG: lipid-binding SYLF domain-containing protein [Planctomycetota bacterium]|jgi:lipid-binding SYLF domain-containing protein